MAYISLKHDSGSSGTDLAAVLAKALGGGTDPSDEINYQRMLSDLQTEKMRRALLGEQTTLATQQAIAQAKLNQYKHEEFIRNSNAGEARGKLIFDAQGNAVPVTEAPVPVDVPIPVPTPSPGPVVPAEPVPDQFISAFPARPGVVPQLPPQLSSIFPARPEVVPPAQMPLPTVTGRPDAPAVSMIPQAPISAFPVRPAGPQLPMPGPPPMNLPDPRTVAEQPVPVDVGTGGSLPGEEALSQLGQQILPALFGSQETAIAGRPAGPQLPQHSPPPEAPVPVDMLQMPALPGPATAPGVPLPIPPQQIAVPDVNRPSEVRPPVQAEPPLPIEPYTVPAPPQPEQPVSLEPRIVPQPQPTTPEARPSTVPPPDPNAGVVKAGTGDTLPAGAPTPPAQILPGTTVDNGDGTVTHTTERGAVKLTREQANALGLQDAFATDAAGQTAKDAGTVKTLYDQNTGFTPAQQAEILSGGQPIGTKEEIAMKQATANPSEGIVEVDKRKYEVMTDAQGNKSLKLMPGQPAAGEANPFGTGDPAAQQQYMSQLVVQKPDPKTWTPQERQNYAIMASINFKSDVKVTDSGKIVYVGGTIPPGLLPPGATAGAAPAGAAPAAQAASAAPDLTGVPPDLAGGGTPAPAPTSPAPAKSGGGGGGPRKDAKGRWVEKVGDLDVPSYGGWRITGQPAEEGTTQSVGGTEITQVPSQSGPTSEDSQDKKAFRYTDQALESAQYMLNLTPDNLTPGVWTRVFKEATDGTTFAALAQKYGTTEQDREYFRHALELIKDFSHQDSGADVTKSDLETYRTLFDLPATPTAKDMINLQKSIKNNIASSRRGFNGNIFPDKLKQMDTKLAKLGIDLDEPVTKEPGQPGSAPTRRRKIVDGKLVDY